MENKPRLYEELKRYVSTDYYPFHMPGHKRRLDRGITADFPNPYGIDITEIEGFDNLHHAEGIIRESMDWAAKLYGADRTYYLVNGSSGGILSAVSGVSQTASILMSRNCHKSVYHGVFLNRLKSRYIYPQLIHRYGIQGGLEPEEIRNLLKAYNDISAVLVVSPTYDGIVSDIRTIAEICHSYQIPLIVDEAHGAHFRYSEIFPVSALELGADVVIQSVHKTLPCFTQSAILHIKEGYINREKIEDYLQIYQSSSPSYLLMAGIEQGIYWMETKGQERMKEFSHQLLTIRSELEGMRHLKILGKEIVGTQGIYDMDISKILVSTKGTEINGTELFDRLRQDYHLELEMCTEDYVTAITTVMDTKTGLHRLKEAFLDIDKSLERRFLYKKDKNFKEKKDSKDKNNDNRKEPKRETDKVIPQQWKWKTEQITTIYEAWSGEKKKVLLEESAGEVIAEFIYLYPPGIPILAPGEKITQEAVDLILHYQKIGLPVQGMRDTMGRYVEVTASSHSEPALG